MSIFTSTDSTWAGSGTRSTTPNRSRKQARHRTSMTAAMAAAPLQALNTRKDFFKSISAAKQPVTVQNRMQGMRAGSSAQPKKAEVNMPKASPAQKDTPYLNRGRTRATDTTSPAVSTWRRR